MTITEMLGQDGILTVLGIGLLVLILIVVIYRASARKANDGSADKNVVTTVSGGSGQTVSQANDAIIVAITAAVNEYQIDNS